MEKARFSLRISQVALTDEIERPAHIHKHFTVDY
jgi:putative NADH-flavin reductase